MSDYLQRLMQRAIPVSPPGQRQAQAIKPSRRLVGASASDQPADFEVETGVLESPAEAAPPGTPRPQAVGTERLSRGDLPAQPAASRPPVAGELSRPQSAPAPRQENPGIAHSRAAEPHPAKILAPRPMPAPAAVEGSLTTVQAPPPAVAAQTGAPPQARPEISPPQAIPLAPAQHHNRPPDQVHAPRVKGHIPAPQPEAASAPVEASPNAAPRDVARLEPQFSTQPEFRPPPGEPAQLTIGSLTVEVLPAPPAPPPHRAAPAPVVQVTRVVPAPSGEGRASKLKFGLGQM